MAEIGSAAELAYPPDLLASLGELADVLISEESVESTIAKITLLAVTTIDSCDYAGVSLVNKGLPHIESVGVTDEIVEHVDKVQYEVGEGPCLSSIEKQATFKIDDFSEDTTWPRFSKEVAGKGVASLVAFVLKVSDESLAALNLYAKAPNVFTDQDIEIGAILAAHAAVTLANAQTHEKDEEKARQLAESVETRTVIGKAIGILMEQSTISGEQAFDILRRVSQRLNIKVRVVAEEMVEKSDKKAKA